MKKNRLPQNCKTCGETFEIRRCEVGLIVTCSKQCSRAYISLRQTGKKYHWGDTISAALRGKKQKWERSPEYRQVMREYAVKRGLGGQWRGKKLALEHRLKMSVSQRGHNRGGWKLSDETRERMRRSARTGAQSHLWKGGVTPLNAKIRTSFEYREWRRKVFERDDYSCQKCGERGGRLHADHIKPFAIFHELRFDVDNGRTLCERCHKLTPTYLNGAKKLMKACLGLEVQEVRA